MRTPLLFRSGDIDQYGRKNSQPLERLRGQLGKQCLQGRARLQLDQEREGTFREKNKVIFAFACSLLCLDYYFLNNFIKV